MKDGHPFETSDLDNIRARQRRELRLVDDWVFDRAIKAYQPVEVEEQARALVEVELRALIDELRMPLASFLDDLAEATRTSTLAAFVVGRSEDDLSLVLQERRRKATQGSIPDPLVTQVLRYVRFLIVADELGRDGYKDPRLPG